jgi:DNA-binding NarL/FixJ family response regulator
MTRLDEFTDTAVLIEVRSLSARERQIVALVAQGFKNKEIAGKISISECTVKSYLRLIHEKLRIRDRLELALYALRYGLYQAGEGAD